MRGKSQQNTLVKKLGALFNPGETEIQSILAYLKEPVCISLSFFFYLKELVTQLNHFCMGEVGNSYPSVYLDRL
jgi:hypothetical protein